MTREEYLRELQTGLEERLTKEETADIVAEYAGFFESGREEGRSEEDVASALGSPAGLVRMLAGEKAGQGPAFPGLAACRARRAVPHRSGVSRLRLSAAGLVRSAGGGLSDRPAGRVFDRGPVDRGGRMAVIPGNGHRYRWGGLADPGAFGRRLRRPGGGSYGYRFRASAPAAVHPGPTIGISADSAVFS